MYMSYKLYKFIQSTYSAEIYRSLWFTKVHCYFIFKDSVCGCVSLSCNVHRTLVKQYCINADLVHVLHEDTVMNCRLNSNLVF